MAPEYFSYEGFGKRAEQDVHYSQAVRLGDIVEISGQGGWDRETEKIDRDTNRQYEIAFDNVEQTLKTAGGKGWEEVFAVRSYHVPMNNEAIEVMSRLLKKYCPNHRPIWTAIGVPRLGFDDMKVEIEVRASSPKSGLQGESRGLQHSNIQQQEEIEKLREDNTKWQQENEKANGEMDRLHEEIQRLEEYVDKVE